MGMSAGKVVEIQLDAAGQVGAWVACPSGLAPAPGQYVMALDESGGSACQSASLAAALFAGGYSTGGFFAAPPLPAGWGPGTQLALRGPFGRGFRVPGSARRLALAALGETPIRLLPLLDTPGPVELEAAIFTDLPLPAAPAWVEVNPLSALPEALAWADFLALDLPWEGLAHLAGRFGFDRRLPLPCPAQALVTLSMPCAGTGECGACAVRERGGWRLACREGPVFDLDELEWRE